MKRILIVGLGAGALGAALSAAISTRTWQFQICLAVGMLAMAIIAIGLQEGQ